MPQILIIDDDIELCELLSTYLANEGLAVTASHQAVAGIQLALSGTVDLVILDVMLPDLNGFDTLRKIREKSRIPIIMLTARGEDVDRIVGLELGADDYLPKPFNPRELVARIRAVKRRIVSTPQLDPVMRTDEIRVGDVTLFPGRRTVMRGNDMIELTSVEFDLLHQLLIRAGEVTSREALSELGLGRPLSSFDRSIDVHISALRKKLGHYQNTQDSGERIKTIRSIGYLYVRPEDSR